MFKKPEKAASKEIQLAQVRVLIADSDTRTADLVRRVLFSFGFKLVFIADNGEDALYMIRSKRPDLIITESRLERKDGLSMVRSIRKMKEDDGIRRDIPIIMLTAQAELPDVQAARDAGITEFLVKPFTAKTLSNRIIQVIDHPRVFVETAKFVGPCRRRRRPDHEGGERRKAPDPKQMATIDASMFAGIPSVITRLERTDEAEIFAPNNALQQAIGGKAEEFLNDTVIAAAQESLMQAEDEYIEWAREDIAKLELAYRELQERPGDPMAHHLLVTAAYSIKAQAGIFGYDFGTMIGKQLVEYLQQNPVMDPKRLLVVRKHIDTINVIFTQRLKNAGKQVAEELMAGLHTLIEKMG